MIKQLPGRAVIVLIVLLLLPLIGAASAQAFHKHHFGHGYYYPYGPIYGHGYYPYGPAYAPAYVVPPPVVYAAPAVQAVPLTGTTLPPAMLAPMAPGAPAGSCLVVREYQTEIEVGGKTVEGYGHACLQADGSWRRGAPAPVR